MQKYACYAAHEQQVCWQLWSLPRAGRYQEDTRLIIAELHARRCGTDCIAMRIVSCMCAQRHTKQRCIRWKDTCRHSAYPAQLMLASDASFTSQAEHSVSLWRHMAKAPST